MTDTPTDVFVGGYRDIDIATRDFDGRLQLVKDEQVPMEGAILVTHDEDGAGNGRAARRPPGSQGTRAGAAASACWSGLRPAAARLRRGRRRRRGGLIGKFTIEGREQA